MMGHSQVRHVRCLALSQVTSTMAKETFAASDFGSWWLKLLRSAHREQTDPDRSRLTACGSQKRQSLLENPDQLRPHYNTGPQNVLENLLEFLSPLGCWVFRLQQSFHHVFWPRFFTSTDFNWVQQTMEWMQRCDSLARQEKAFSSSTCAVFTWWRCQRGAPIQVEANAHLDGVDMARRSSDL